MTLSSSFLSLAGQELLLGGFILGRREGALVEQALELGEVGRDIGRAARRRHGLLLGGLLPFELLEPILLLFLTFLASLRVFADRISSSANHRGAHQRTPSSHEHGVPPSVLSTARSRQ